MTRAEFFAAFPEFSQVDPDYIDVKLAEAALEVDVNVWGATYDTGHGYLTAHKLAISPMGQMARLVDENGETTFGKQFKILSRKAACGLRST